MTNEGKLFGRRRRANVSGEQRREKVYRVKVSPSEDAVLRSRAEVLEVTVPRLLFEAATDPVRALNVEWRAAGSELMQVKTLMGRVSNNLNQLAKFANTEGQFPAEVEALTAEYKAMLPRVFAALDRLQNG